MVLTDDLGLAIQDALIMALGYVEVGNFKDAQHAIEWATRSTTDADVTMRRANAAVRAWALVDPSFPGEAELEAAFELQEREAPLDGKSASEIQSTIVAALYSMAGEHRIAFEILESYRPRWYHVPTTGYYLARSALALGYEDMAREMFQRACRMRPKLAERFSQGEEGRLLSRARRESEELATKTVEEKEALRVEETGRLLNLSQIEALEFGYRFADAAAEYRTFAGRVTSKSTWEEATRKADRAAALGALFDRIVARAGSGGLGSVELAVGAAKATLAGGDAKEAELRIGSGSARVPWAFLRFADFAALAAAVSPTPAEWLALGSLSLASGADDQAWPALARAAKDDACRAEVDRLVADRRGMDVPAGGFVWHKGSFVTPEEKSNLDRGLVLFRGEWVTVEDRKRTLAGYRKVRGEWTRLSDEELFARGWEKSGGDWLTPAEVAAKKGLWDQAEERQTAHFVLRSDRGAGFLDELGKVLEAAWPEYEETFGSKPSSDRKLVVLAFKDFEGYREYCRKIGQTDTLGALGFAPSEEYTCCGYDKFGDTEMFLDTLVHEGAHLFYWVTFHQNVPSWLAEGMATYFEGFRRTSGGWEFHLPSETRLDTLRGVLGAGIDLEALSTGEAGRLIQTSPSQAIEFYARAWGLFYFMARSIDPIVQEIFREVLERARRGQEIDLPSIVRPERRKAFDAALAEFLGHL